MPAKRKVEQPVAGEVVVEEPKCPVGKKPKTTKKDAAAPPNKDESSAPAELKKDNTSKQKKKQTKAGAVADVGTTEQTPPSVPDDDRSVIESLADTAVSTVTSTSTALSLTKKAKKTKKLKKLSARTPSSYVLFSLEKRRDIMLENPGFILGDVSKACGAAWKSLNEEEKEPWKEKATQLKVERRKELDAILESQPKKKKRTPSSYLLFAVEHRKVIVEEDSTLKIAQVSKKCGELWQKLSDEEKAVWKEKANVLKAAVESVS